MRLLNLAFPLLLGLASSLAPRPVAAQAPLTPKARVALVIGNAAYPAGTRYADGPRSGRDLHDGHARDGRGGRPARRDDHPRFLGYRLVKALL